MDAKSVRTYDVESAKRFKRGSVLDVTYAEWHLPCRVYARRGSRVFLREVQS